MPDTHYFNLFNRISHTHFVEVIRVEEPLKRLFYQLECMKGTWSVKELKRQVGSLLYERTRLSQNKEKWLSMTEASPDTNTFTQLVQDPYVFEFLGLRQPEVLPEKELEQSLLDHLLQLLVELCKHVEFATAGMDDKVFVAKYLVALPDKK